MKLCQNCGNQITNGRYKFCSVGCMDVNTAKNQHRYYVESGGLKQKQNIQCKHCSKEFAAHSHHRFCSSKCRVAFFNAGLMAKRTKLELLEKRCKFCKVSFYPKLTNRQKFCSKKCSRKDSRHKNRTQYSKKRYQKRKLRLQTDPIFRAKVNKRASDFICKRLKNDPAFRIKFELRNRVRRLLKHKKDGSISSLIGCSVGELRLHLQSRFSPFMTWDNYGKYWVVDHIIPLASFNLEDHEQRKIACHYTNLQPLTRTENAIKSDKILDGQLSIRFPLALGSTGQPASRLITGSRVTTPIGTSTGRSEGQAHRGIALTPVLN